MTKCLERCSAFESFGKNYLRGLAQCHEYAIFCLEDEDGASAKASPYR